MDESGLAPKGCHAPLTAFYWPVKALEVQRGKLKIFRRRKGQLVVSYQVVTDPCCGLLVIFCGFIWHLNDRETNIPEISLVLTVLRERL